MKARALLHQLAQLPPRTIAGVAAAHAVLLAGAVWGGLPYVLLQALLAVEIVLLNIASVPLYPERGWGKHIADVLKVSAGMLFVVFFLFVTYGVAAQGGEGYALEIAWRDAQAFDRTAALWSIGYIVVHLAFALQQALRSADPRGSWKKNVLADGGVTFVAMFLMVFVAIFVGAPLVKGLAVVGVDVDASLVLATLMVLLRFVLSLVGAAISQQEMAAISRNPDLA
jgi:F0F1-type ATP synthase membrane subunit a